MSQLLQFYKSFQQSRLPQTKAAPTFEDLTIDDKLTEHQRVVRYVKSTIGLQRLVHVKMLADVSEQIGVEDTIATIVPLLEPLSKDVEPVVKQHLVEQLKHIAKFCFHQGAENGYRVVLDKILPITANLLEDEKQEVRQSASMTLVEIAQLVRLDDIGQHILTVILRLAHEDDKEEMRMTAAQLLNLLAESLGQDLCRQFVIPEVVSLAEDPVFRVRKSTALNFHTICKIGGEHELLERLMPAFVRLSKDDMYRVRRACAESLSEISKNVSEDIRLGVLVEIFLRLAHDPSKLVKQSILQQSGMFIATLPKRAVNETILSQYCSMASNPTGDVAVDAELRHICAYSFPAVLQIIGKERWHEVRDIYHNLAQSRSANIKQTLAYSLHEIAKILNDGQLVEEELIPVFEEMIQDVEIVQVGVIKYLAAFLRMLPDLCRVSYLPILHEILHSTNPFNWRLRQYLAIQLPELVALPPKPDVYRTLFPTVMTLLQDPVVSVRTVTFQGVSSMLNCIYLVSQNEGNVYKAEEVAENKLNLEEVIKAVNNLITSDKCQMRQLWMELSLQLVKDIPKELFEQHFLPGVLHLTCDTVLNVRLAVAMFLAGWDPEYPAPWEEDPTVVNPWKWLLARTDIKTCVERLSNDDRDVYLNVSKLQSIYPDITFRNMSCRGKKIPPGGNTPITVDSSPAPTPTVIYPPTIEMIQARNEIIHSRVRSNSRTSRSGSVDCNSESADAIGRLQRLSMSSRDEDDDDKPSFSDMNGSMSNDDELDEVEREFVSTLHNPVVEEELDIIDGILKTHTLHKDEHAKTESDKEDDDDDEHLEMTGKIESEEIAIEQVDMQSDLSPRDTQDMIES